MEDNETNQNLALQVLAMVDQGCMLKLVEEDMLIALGYAEMWLDRNMMFFCEMGDGSTGKMHVLKFGRFDPRSNQVIFYNQEGDLIAGLAPYSEWPEVNTDDMQSGWEQWKKELAQGALEHCQKAGRAWRHADLNGKK